MTDRRGETVNYATPEQIAQREMPQGWGGPSVEIEEKSPWKDLQEWEKRNLTVVVLTVCPDDIREYHDDDRFEGLTDEQIFPYIESVVGQQDFSYDWDYILTSVKDEIENDIETNKQNTNPAWGSASTTME